MDWGIVPHIIQVDDLLTKQPGIIEGYAYIIGINGHIYLDDPAVSRQHADIRIFKGRIILRDLNSTNGLHLFKNGVFEKFKKGFVQPEEQVLIGMKLYTPRDLFAKLGFLTP